MGVYVVKVLAVCNADVFFLTTAILATCAKISSHLLVISLAKMTKSAEKPYSIGILKRWSYSLNAARKAKLRDNRRHYYR